MCFLPLCKDWKISRLKQDNALQNCEYINIVRILESFFVASPTNLVSFASSSRKGWATCIWHIKCSFWQVVRNASTRIKMNACTMWYGKQLQKSSSPSITKGVGWKKIDKKNRRWVQVTKRNFSLKCRKMRTQQYRKQHAFVDRSYLIQISKILFGLFMTFRKIFMCYLEKYTIRNLSCQVCNFYYALNKVQHVICHGLISMSNLSLHIVKIEIFYQQQLSLKYSYTNQPQHCLKAMQGNWNKFHCSWRPSWMI